MAEHKTVAELTAMTMDERVAYFLAHPLPGTSEEDAQFVARHRAKAVDTIAKRDAAPAARGARRAS